MNKTPEEAYKYVLDYKNDLIKTYNEDSQDLYHRGNDVDIKLGSDLIVLASASIAVSGGILVSQIANNDPPKIAAILTIIALFISIGGGLKYYSDAQKYWKKWADIKHEQAGMVHADTSKTVEQLDIFMKKFTKKGKEAPAQGRTSGRTIQIISFVVGVALLVSTAVMLAFFNQPTSAIDTHRPSMCHQDYCEH